MTATTYSATDTIPTQAPDRRRTAADASRIGVRVIVVGAALAVVAAGWPLPVGPTLVFGVAVLLWALATMATEEPGARP